MKTPILPGVIAAALVFAVTGCGNNSSSTSSSDGNSNSSGSIVTAPVDYLNAAAKGEQNAVKTVDLTSVTQAIQLFYTDKGRYPKTLDELVVEKYLVAVPTPPYGTSLDYDPVAGTVKIVKQ